MRLLKPITIADNVINIGEIPEKDILFSARNIILSTDRKVFRIDRTGSSVNVIEDTANAINTVPNSFSPFGTNFMPPGTTIKLYDSEDGVWASHELTDLIITSQDGTIHASILLCLQSGSGYCKIQFGTNVNRKSWTPSSDPETAAPLRKYIMMEMNNGTQKDAFIFACVASDLQTVFISPDTVPSATVALRASDLQIKRIDTNFTWIESTAIDNGDINVSPGDGGVATAVYEPGFEVILGFSSVPRSIEDYTYRRSGDGTVVATWATEMWTNAGWVSTLGFTSGNNNTLNGPATETTPAIHTSSTITPPSGLVKQSIGNLNQQGGGTIVTPVAYYFRARLLTSSTIRPLQTPIYRSKTQLTGRNDVIGYEFSQNETITGIQLDIEGTKSGSGTRQIQLIIAKNETSEIRSINILDTVIVPGLQNRIVFTNPISVVAGDKLLISSVNGGITITDVTPIITN